jgi:hypothetical protein
MSYKITNNKLHQIIRRVVESELALLKPFMNGNMFEDFLQKTKSDYPYVGKFVEDNLLPTRFNDYYILLITGEHKEEMEQLPEYVEYKKAMLSDSVISRHFREQVGNSRFVLTLYDWTFVYFILNHMLDSYLSTDNFNSELFDKLYCDLEYFLYNERIPITIVAPLHNFDTDVWDLDSIKIDNKLLIRKITEGERNKFWKYMAFNRLTFGEIGKFEYVIQSSHSVS